MKTKHHRILLITLSLILGNLTACTGIKPSRQNNAIYDFGLSIPAKDFQPITSKVPFENPVATEDLNHNKIRYRLNYQNPLRVYHYAESRWSAPPSVLIKDKLNTLAMVTTPPLNCSLKLEIKAFDHVFQTITNSEGVVQLKVSLIEKKQGKVISNQMITENMRAPSNDAKGGVTALDEASEIALRKAIDWSNATAENNSLCN